MKTKLQKNECKVSKVSDTEKEKTYWVYILHCSNGTYYTGYTTNLNRRYEKHVKGSGKCKYTRSFKPTRIAASLKIEGNRSLAMHIERRIKRMSKREKERLILNPDLLNAMFET
ncbi:MAG: GIY-YIG nuclease family protein [Proteobacteria bacterium]|nr:GIY-YIG nuclease family protein [Pseudomonadota bacterium]